LRKTKVILTGKASFAAPCLWAVLGMQFPS